VAQLGSDIVAFCAEMSMCRARDALRADLCAALTLASLAPTFLTSLIGSADFSPSRCLPFCSLRAVLHPIPSGSISAHSSRSTILILALALRVHRGMDWRLYSISLCIPLACTFGSKRTRYPPTELLLRTPKNRSHTRRTGISNLALRWQTTCSGRGRWRGRVRHIPGGRSRAGGRSLG
jgi:hypothetical protein